MVKFNTNAKQIPIKSKTLDSYNFKKIKLLKLEAEGSEFEVLNGSLNTLKNIDYISVDYGPEEELPPNSQYLK